MKRIIVASKYVSDLTKVDRTWKERLFTLPWNPFKKTKTVKSQIAYCTEDGFVYVSYETFEKWKSSGQLEELEMMYEDEAMGKRYPSSGNA